MTEAGILEIRPQPKQVLLHSCPADIAFFGGSAGGGKSFAMAIEALRWHETHGFSAVIFRRTGPELVGGGSIWEECSNIYPSFGGEMREHRLDCRFPSGALIEFRHLQYEKDKLAHQGKQYALTIFEELTHFEPSQFWYLISRLRSTCGVKPYCRATLNPDPDHFSRKMIDWWIDDDGFAIPERSGIVRWFIRVDDDLIWSGDEYDLLEFYPGHEPMSFTFIAASLEDNQELLKKDPQYRARLLALPRIDRERLLGGNWNVRPAAGMYYRRSYFEFIDAAPAAGVAETVRAWDEAASKPTPENPDPDWTVGVKYSRMKDGSFVIQHAERGQEGPLGVERMIKNTAEGDGKRVRVCLWQDPGGAGKAHAQHMVRLLNGFVVRVTKASENKETYAGPCSSQAEAGNIKIVKGEWNEPFLRVLEGFPTGNKKDDVDALSLAHLQCSNTNLERLRRLATL